MLETRDLYKDYIAAINEKLNSISIKMGQYYGSIKYTETCIINNRVEFEKLDVNIDSLFANPHIAYIKIKGLVDNGQLTRVAHYVKSYVLALQYLTLHKNLYDRLTKSIMPYEVYVKMIGYLDSEISRHLLEGGYYSMGHVGKFYILERERLFLFNGKPVKLPVDWGNSNKLKQQLIDEGKIPYNIHTAPDGVKWHTYHNSDYAYWFWWLRGPIKNRGFFKFIPSNFRPTKWSRKKFTSKEELLNCPSLGNVQKMWRLMQIDPLHFMNYKRQEEKIIKETYKLINI